MARSKTVVKVGYLLVLMAIIRLVMLGSYPLMDTTEARYAEIARKMVELNDWITPWFDYGVPFWGKPPLSFWMTAISFKFFGINEFAARLPHYLCGLLILWILWYWLSQTSRKLAFSSITILATSLIFFASSGLVMTDMWLLLGIILAMIGFWGSISGSVNPSRLTPWLFFIGISIGLLAKGPLTLVLAGIPIGLWILVRKEYSQVWKALPWIRGALLTLLLTAPWYIAAELKTPGFLDYFLVGEHFNRFVISGWQGDLYGTAHDRPRGTIWFYLWTDALPWSILFILLPIYLWKNKKLTRYRLDDCGWDLYLLLWIFTPAVFFSFAGNILWPYVLPGLPALSIFLAQWLDKQKKITDSTRHNFMLVGVITSVAIFVIFSIILLVGDETENKSARQLVSQYHARDIANGKLVYFGKRPFSASFYSQGKALEALTVDELAHLSLSSNLSLAIRPIDEHKLPTSMRNRLSKGKSVGRYQLFELQSDLKNNVKSLAKSDDETP